MAQSPLDFLGDMLGGANRPPLAAALGFGAPRSTICLGQ